MKKKKRSEPIAITLEGWRAMERFIVHVTIRHIGHKRQFSRAVGPFNTRSEASNCRVRLEKEILKDDRIESYEVSTCKIWTPSMYKDNYVFVDGPNEVPWD